MKNSKPIRILFLIFSGVFVFSGCLDENPKDQILEEKTQGTLQSLYLNYVASLYTNIGGYKDSEGLQGTTRGIYDFNTLTTDEAMIPIRGGDWFDGGFWKKLYLHTWGVNNQALKAVWEYLYRVIILSNHSIEVLENNKERFDPQKIEEYIAEVRAFRAIYYFYLLDFFARVPITTSSTIPISEIMQRERSEVFHFIVKELTTVIPSLSDSHSNRFGAYYGRVTQPVAYFGVSKIIPKCRGLYP